MPPKKTTPEGELTAPELRKLIRAHNILSKITIPKGTDRQGLIKLIEGKNYDIDHKNKVIKPKVKRGKQITLKQAEELTKPKPVSEAVKKQRAEKKKEQEEEKKIEIKIAKKEAVQEFKQKKKEAQKLKSIRPRKILKKENLSKGKENMGETAFIKQQKKLQLQKQKETRRALLKSKPPVDKTTRRGKPVKKEEPKKEEASFKGIKLNSSEDIYFKEEVDILDYVDKEYDTNGFKDPQITKLEKLFKLVEENPKYLISLGIDTNRGADPSPYDEGNIYIIPYYMENGPNEPPANKKPFKYIKLKGKPKKVVKKSEALKQKKKSRIDELMKKFNFKNLGEAQKTIEDKKYPELYKKLRPLEKEQNEIIKEIRSGKYSLKEKAPLMEKEKQIKIKINEINKEIRKAKPNKITKEEQELLDLISKINMN